jgi:hypothetical protein
MLLPFMDNISDEQFKNADHIIRKKIHKHGIDDLHDLEIIITRGYAIAYYVSRIEKIELLGDCRIKIILKDDHRFACSKDAFGVEALLNKLELENRFDLLLNIN